jgi:putative tryptophan/tyrosine transport system substrate-binding protein
LQSQNRQRRKKRLALNQLRNLHGRLQNIEDWRAAVIAVSNARPKPDAVFQLCDPVTLSRRKALVDFAANSRLPSMYEMKEYVIECGLMAYGPSLAAMSRRSAHFVDRILKGAKPAELPAEQPSRFEFVVNLKTAKAMGFEMPPALLARADEVITRFRPYQYAVSYFSAGRQVLKAREPT